ncbi:MAG: YscO family type III secretion system apparatus protein [Gammaproteobacteria bacterium]
MSNDLNELKEIRELKFENQQQVVNQLEQELQERGTALDLIGSTIELYKENKATMEAALFTQIEGQEVVVDELNVYADKMKELSSYGDQLEGQYIEMQEQRAVSENTLEKARKHLVACRNDVEKIKLLIEEEQKKDSVANSKKEENEIDEDASLQWNRNS